MASLAFWVGHGQCSYRNFRVLTGLLEKAPFLSHCTWRVHGLTLLPTAGSLNVEPAQGYRTRPWRETSCPSHRETLRQLCLKCALSWSCWPCGAAYSVSPWLGFLSLVDGSPIHCGDGSLTLQWIADIGICKVESLGERKMWKEKILGRKRSVRWHGLGW